MPNDGEIDYSSYSREQLQSAVKSIDARQYPKNYARLVRAIEEKNKTAPLAINLDAETSTTAISDSKTYFKCLRRYYFGYVLRKELVERLFALALCVAFALWPNVNPVWRMTAVTLAVALIAWPPISFLLMYLRITSRAGREGIFGGEVRAVVSGTGFTLSDTTGTRIVFTWDHVEEVLETDEAIVFVYKGGRGFVPLRKSEALQGIGLELRDALRRRNPS